MLAQLKAAVGEVDYGRLSARAAKEAGLSARKVRGRLAPIRAAPVAAEYEKKKGFISEALYSHDMPQISLHRKSNLKMILFRL